MGANDRESLAGDPARAHRDGAHESEQERQQTCGQPPAVRAVRLHFGLHPDIRAAVDGGRTRAAETDRIGTLRRVAPSSRVKPCPRRCPCGGRLALGSNDRRSGSGSWSDSRPRGSGRTRRPADLPGDAGGRIGTRSDPDPGRRRRRSGVALRGGRLDRRDRRRRLLLGAGAGAGSGGATCGGAGEVAATGGAVADGGSGAGGASGAGGGLGAPRGGRRPSGSTYVSAAPTRTPRCT